MVEHSDAERRPFLRRKQGGQAALALPARFERDNPRPAHDRTARAIPSAARATRMRSSRVVISVSTRAEGLGRSCGRSEVHTSELQSLMRIANAVFWLKKKNH